MKIQRLCQQSAKSNILGSISYASHFSILKLSIFELVEAHLSHLLEFSHKMVCKYPSFLTAEKERAGTVRSF